MEDGLLLGRVQVFEEGLFVRAHGGSGGRKALSSNEFLRAAKDVPHHAVPGRLPTRIQYMRLRLD